MIALVVVLQFVVIFALWRKVSKLEKIETERQTKKEQKLEKQKSEEKNRIRDRRYFNDFIMYQLDMNNFKYEIRMKMKKDEELFNAFRQKCIKNNSCEDHKVNAFIIHDCFNWLDRL